MVTAPPPPTSPPPHAGDDYDPDEFADDGPMDVSIVFPIARLTWESSTPTWSLLGSDDPAARATVEANKAMIIIAKACTPQPGDDVIAHHSSIQGKLGITRARAETYSSIGLLCERMPRLARHISRGMLSVDHLRLLARSVDGVHLDDTEAAESALIKVLTPRRVSQAMHSPRAMFNRILKKLYAIDALARPVDHTEPEAPRANFSAHLDEDPDSSDCSEGEGGTDTTESATTDSGTTDPERLAEQEAIEAATAAAVEALTNGGDPGAKVARRISVDTYDPASTVITATLTAAEGAEFMTILDAVCSQMRCNRADALMNLARGTAEVDVTLNIYREIDSDIACTDSGHWLDALATEKFMQRVTHLRVPGQAATETYTPTPQIRDFVAASYGTCTFPGCEVPAEKCDLDHIARYNHDAPDDGGPTDTRNLHPACRKHHQLKTLGWWDVTRAPDGAVMWTSIDDGHSYITEPSGPLAGYARTTFAERASRRYRAVRNHNIRLTGRQHALQQALLAARAAEAESTDSEEVPF